MFTRSTFKRLTFVCSYLTFKWIHFWWKKPANKVSLWREVHEKMLCLCNLFTCSWCLLPPPSPGVTQCYANIPNQCPQTFNSHRALLVADRENRWTDKEIKFQFSARKSLCNRCCVWWMFFYTVRNVNGNIYSILDLKL